MFVATVIVHHATRRALRRGAVEIPRRDRRTHDRHVPLREQRQAHRVGEEGSICVQLVQNVIAE